ncbi:hypothetical protein PanWU01x14_047740 [Parasponia andersonii]|uniref:Uncharacterized protein n=1 Tax=Parasponia andersonii TaxID=3476 RepID=A0A2P5DN48_PARAD|nr:hypothetical protein PanWU01x14_047740 [Parasponia andersonii]
MWSGTACPHGEITELSVGTPRLKSQLSSPPPVLMKRGREPDSSKGKESPAGKRGKAAPCSDIDDDEAMLTLMRRRRSTRSGPSGGFGQEKTEKSHSGGAPRGVAAEVADVAVVAVASSAKDAPPPAVTESAFGDTLPPTVLTSAASGASKEAIIVHLVEEEGILVVGGVKPHSSDADNAQGEGPVAEFELEVLSLENVELVAGHSITQV